MRGLIVTHGDLGLELIASARLIAGGEVVIDALSNSGRGSRELAAAIAEWLDAERAPATVMVDEARGSCGTAAQLAAAGRQDCWILGGVNLPMVVTYLSRVGQLEGEELVNKIHDRAREAVRRMDDPR